MKAMIEGTLEQIRAAERITGQPARLVAETDNGNIASFTNGPTALMQLAEQMDIDPEEVTPWGQLDHDAQEEIALLTVNSAPWAMDQEIHANAAQDISDETRAKITAGPEGPETPETPETTGPQDPGGPDAQRYPVETSLPPADARRAEEMFETVRRGRMSRTEFRETFGVDGLLDAMYAPRPGRQAPVFLSDLLDSENNDSHQEALATALLELEESQPGSRPVGQMPVGRRIRRRPKDLSDLDPRAATVLLESAVHTTLDSTSHAGARHNAALFAAERGLESRDLLMPHLTAAVDSGTPMVRALVTLPRGTGVHDVPMLVSTGSPRSFLSPADAVRLGWNPDPTEPAETELVWAGQRSPGALAQVSVTLVDPHTGRIPFGYVEIGMAQQGSYPDSRPSVLGMDLLNNLVVQIPASVPGKDSPSTVPSDEQR